MAYKFITNETLKKKFQNQFELVSYAISLAENMIVTGRDPRVKTDTQNRAMQVLEEIVAGKDQFEPVIPAKKQEERSQHHSHENDGSSHKSAPERKRARKILVD